MLLSIGSGPPQPGWSVSGKGDLRNPLFWFLFVGASLAAIILAYQSTTPIQILVGQRSADPFIVGFSFREQAGVGAFRWSGPRASLFFRGIGSQDGTLRIDCGSPLAGATLRVNGEQLARQGICGGPASEYTFLIERAQIGVQGDLLVTLESDTFSAPPDTRQLGVQVISAGFIPQGGMVLPSPWTALYVVLVAALGIVVVRAWSGSTGAAWATGALVVLAGAWGLCFARLEAAWLARTLFWLGLVVAGMAGVVVWLLRRFFPIDVRTMRLLGLCLLVALAVRMPLAVTPGFVTDVQDYVVWSYKLVVHGLHSAYVPIEGLWIADYPPVILYLFQGLGAVYRTFFAPDFLYPVTAGDPALRAVTDNAAILADPIHRTLLRLPAITADLITGALVFALARARLSTRKSLLIAASYWFNPAILYNSALWGQTDAVHTLLVVLAVALVEASQIGWGFLALAVGGLTKPQAFVFGPLLLLRSVQLKRWRGVSLAGIGGAAGIALAVMPMLGAGALPGLLAHFGSTIGHHPILSANAHNFWWFVTRGAIGAEDTNLLLFGISYRLAGLILFATAYALALAATLRRPHRDIWPVAAYVGFAFFILPTEIHENYGFAVLALLAVAVAAEKRYALLYILLTLTMVTNYALHDPNVYALLGLSAPDAQLSTARWLDAALNVVVFGAWTIKELSACSLPDPEV
jgi:hypothetical protein